MTEEKRPRNPKALPGEASFHKSLVRAAFSLRDQARIMSMWRATQLVQMASPRPINMVLHCPHCGNQHIDRQDETVEVGTDPMPPLRVTAEPWTNPPHRTHLCHFCGFKWRPADVPTNGVKAVKTKGQDDTPLGTSLGFAVDAMRYQAWRDAMISQDPTFVVKIADALPADVGTGRAATADEWDRALDAARGV